MESTPSNASSTMARVAKQNNNLSKVKRFPLHLSKERRQIGEQKWTITGLQKTNKRLRDQLVALRVQTLNGGQCGFLKKLPIEVRNMVYRLLLVNPELGKVSTLGKWINDGDAEEEAFEYGLSPSILRTCLQILTEASTVLYGENTFAVLCTEHSDHPMLPLCPLTRYLPHLHKDPSMNNFDFQSIVSLNKVKHWKIVARHQPATRKLPDQYKKEPQTLALLLRAIGNTMNVSIEIVIVVSDERLPVVWDEMVKRAKSHLESAAYHLADIRRGKETRVRIAHLADLTDNLFQGPHRSQYPPEPSREQILDAEDSVRTMLQELQQHCKSTNVSKVERVYEMYDNLLTYAKTFERSEEFRSEMGNTYKDVLEPGTLNPFRYKDQTTNWHPIERLLRVAQHSTYTHDNEDLRVKRAKLLQFLEPNFQRIYQSMSELHDFVRLKGKGGKGGNVIFSGLSSCQLDADEGRKYLMNCSYALLLIQRCAKAFERDLPDHILVIMRQEVTLYPDVYEDLERERWMRKMSGAIKLRSPSRFVKNFKLVADDMIGQFRQMCDARKHLFDFDLADPGCDIDVATDFFRTRHTD